MTLLTLRGLGLVLVTLLASAAEGSCVDDYGLWARDENRLLNDRYLYETNGRRGIRNRGGPASNEGFFLRGDRTLAILWHGFMASPPEVRPLARHLASELGISVYAPLLPGFGAGAEVANHFKLRSWRASIRRVIEEVPPCFETIVLVGYSIGGGLVLEHLLEADPLDSRVAAVVLLSPFVETARWMMPWSGSALRQTVLVLLRHLFRMRSLGLRTVQRVKPHYRDLALLIEDPETYDQRFSLRAGRNILALAGQLKRERPAAGLLLPAFFAYSESDRTASWKATRAFMDHHWSVRPEELVWPAAAEVPHEIVVPHAWNPNAEDLFTRVSDFVQRNTQRPQEQRPQGQRPQGQGSP